MRGEFVDVEGARIYYYAAGTRGAGEPIVLIHGFPTSSHLWLDVVAKLPAGHRVVVVDLLGFGRSDAPPAADYSVRGHATRLLRILDSLHIDRAVIVGHDIGGAVASQVALLYPHRVSGLALIDSATSSGWFASPHPVAKRVGRLLLHLPSWC